MPVKGNRSSTREHAGKKQPDTKADERANLDTSANKAPEAPVIARIKPITDFSKVRHACH